MFNQAVVCEYSAGKNQGTVHVDGNMGAAESSVDRSGWSLLCVLLLLDSISMAFVENIKTARTTRGPYGQAGQGGAANQF